MIDYVAALEKAKDRLIKRTDHLLRTFKLTPGPTRTEVRELWNSMKDDPVKLSAFIDWTRSQGWTEEMISQFMTREAVLGMRRES